MPTIYLLPRKKYPVARNSIQFAAVVVHWIARRRPASINRLGETNERKYCRGRRHRDVRVVRNGNLPGQRRIPDPAAARHHPESRKIAGEVSDDVELFPL